MGKSQAREDALSRPGSKCHTHYCGRCNRNFLHKGAGCKAPEHTLCGDCATVERLLGYFGQGWLREEIQETFDTIQGSLPEAPAACVALPQAPEACEECGAPTLNRSCMGGKSAPRPLCFVCEDLLASVAFNPYFRQANADAQAEHLEALARKRRLLDQDGGMGRPPF